MAGLGGLAGIGAGFGQFAEYLQRQQAQNERSQTLKLTLQKFQQEQDDRNAERQLDSGLFNAMLGGKPSPGSGGVGGVGGGASGWGTLASRPGSGGAPASPYAPTPAGSGMSSGLLPVISRHESGNRPLIGWGETDLSGYPLSDTGFPMWPGKPGPEGNSTAAGLYQITRTTWDPIARRFGIKDFSEESQGRVATELLLTRGVQPWAPHNPKLAAALARGEGSGGAGRPVAQPAVFRPSAPNVPGAVDPRGPPGLSGEPYVGGMYQGDEEGPPLPWPSRSPTAPSVIPLDAPTSMPAAPAGARGGSQTTPSPVVNPPATPATGAQPQGVWKDSRLPSERPGGSATYPRSQPSQGGGATGAQRQQTWEGGRPRFADPAAAEVAQLPTGAAESQSPVGQSPAAPGNALSTERGSRGVAGQLIESIPMQDRGRKTQQEIAQMIEQAMPSAPGWLKAKKVKEMQAQLAPEEREKFQLWMQENSQIFQAQQAEDRAARTDARTAKTAADTAAAAAIHEDQRTARDVAREDNKWDLLTDPTNNQQYRYRKSSGTARDLTSDTPYAPGGAQKLGGGAGATASAGREADVAAEIKRLDAEFITKNPNATGDERQKAHFANRQAAEKMMTRAKTAEASTPAGMFMRRYLTLNPDAKPEEISRQNAEVFVRDSVIERNFSGGTGATQMRAVNTVADHVKLVRRFANAMETRDFPRANTVLQFFSKEGGYPEVTTFEVGRDIMADEVVRLLTSTGGTESDRAGMQSRFKAAASPDQMNSALGALEEFVVGRFKGLEQSYALNDPHKLQTFREKMLTPEARELYLRVQGANPSPAAGSAPAGTAAAVPVPAGLASDPDGAGYEKDGATWVKRGNQLIKTPGAVRTQ